MSLRVKDLRDWLESARYFAGTGPQKKLSRQAQALMAERLVLVIEDLMRVRGLLPSDRMTYDDGLDDPRSPEQILRDRGKS